MQREKECRLLSKVNERIAGKTSSFYLKKPAYTGCPIGCGEPLVNDIGIMKIRDGYDLYIGGKAKGKDAQIGTLFMEQLIPEQLYVVVENQLIAIYAEQGKKREPFFKFISRLGIDHLKNHIEETNNE